MTNNLQFNDTLVQQNMETLLKVEIGFNVITHNQIAEVKRILKLDEMSENELRATRNSLVKLLSAKERAEEDFEKSMVYYNTMSGTTAVIDSILFKMGKLL